MHALERNVPYRSSDLGLIRFHNIQILRTENHLNGFVVLKSLIHTFKLETIKLYQEIFDHRSFYNIGFSDKACNKTVFRLIVDICRRTDLLNLTVIHNNNRI